MSEPEYDLPGEDQDELDAVEIRDNGERLVDFVALCPELRFSPTHPVYEFPRVHIVRESVARMLCEAAKNLKSIEPRYTLQIVEGYRPLSVQRAMFKDQTEKVRRRFPDADEKRLMAEAGRFSAPPEAKTPPPHITGGAVDLEIVNENGDRLDFSSPYDILDPRQAGWNSQGLSETALRNRELLKAILEPTGLTPYVDEWWHWSFGDNGWALRVKAPFALYDRIEMPPDAEWVGDLSKLPEEET
jgi:D-alanyl-D-alanine dipeptidase